MKWMNIVLVLGLFCLPMLGCNKQGGTDAQFGERVGKVLKENPKILTEAIKANPDVFMDALQEAAKNAQEGMAKKRADEEGWDLDTIGHYGLSIRDTRRGGGTSELGIGFKFRKTRLRILEIPKMDQVESFDFLDEDLKIDVGDLDSVGMVESDGLL